MTEPIATLLPSSEQEAMPERLKALLDRLDAYQAAKPDIDPMRRDQEPSPGARHVDPQPVKNLRLNMEVSVGNILTIVVMLTGSFIAYGQFTSTMSGLANGLKSTNDRIDNVVSDITARRTFINTRLEDMGTRVEDIPLMRDALKQQQGNVDRIAKNLDDGRQERQKQIDDGRDRQAETSKGLALLAQRQDSFEKKLDKILERMEVSRQNPVPFGRDQSWPYLKPLPTLPPGLKARIERPGPTGRRMALAEVGR